MLAGEGTQAARATLTPVERLLVRVVDLRRVSRQCERAVRAIALMVVLATLFVIVMARFAWIQLVRADATLVRPGNWGAVVTSVHV